MLNQIEYFLEWRLWLQIDRTLLQDTFEKKAGASLSMALGLSNFDKWASFDFLGTYYLANRYRF